MKQRNQPIKSLKKRWKRRNEGNMEKCIDNEWKIHELAVKYSLSYPISFSESKKKIGREFMRLFTEGRSQEEVYRIIDSRIRNGELFEGRRGDSVG
jgi:hypothetical protein